MSHALVHVYGSTWLIMEGVNSGCFEVRPCVVGTDDSLIVATGQLRVPLGVTRIGAGEVSHALAGSGYMQCTDLGAALIGVTANRRACA